MYLLSKVLTLASLFCLSLAQAETNTCKHRILFLPQEHTTIINGNVNLRIDRIEEVAKSQFMIAKYLEKNQKLPVFSEQVDTTMSFPAIESLSREQKMQLDKKTEEYRTLFEQGLPENYEDLNMDQKIKIAKSGGEIIQFMLNRIPKLYKVVENRATQDAIFARINELKRGLKSTDKISIELAILSIDVRERAALNEINNYFKNNPSQRDVILIYGGGHNFARYPNLFPPECIKVPFKFQKFIKEPFVLHPESSSSVGID